jgi:hypothetical protein
MNLFIVLLLVIISLVLILMLTILILFAFYPLKASFSFNSELQQDFHLIVTWLSSSFKAIVYRSDDENLITIYLFDKKLFTKPLKKHAKRYTNILDLIKTIRPEHIKLQSSYGFEDPSVTGMICGTFDILSQYIVLDDLYNNPDFYTQFDYFKISAEAEIDLFSTLIRILKTKKFHSFMASAHGNK